MDVLDVLSSFYLRVSLSISFGNARSFDISYGNARSFDISFGNARSFDGYRR